MLKREVERIRDLANRFTELLAEGLVSAVTEDDEGTYQVEVNLDLEHGGLDSRLVTAESGRRVEVGERVWAVFPRGDLNATPYVLGGLRPRRTRLALGTRAGDAPGAPLQFGGDGTGSAAWRKLGDVDLTRYRSTWLAVGSMHLGYAGSQQNLIRWSAGVEVLLAATGGGDPGSARTDLLGSASSHHQVPLDSSGQAQAGLALALRVDRGGDEVSQAAIWCGLRHGATSEAELVTRVDTGRETEGSGRFVTSVSVDLVPDSVPSAVSAASVDVELYELG